MICQKKTYFCIYTRQWNVVFIDIFGKRQDCSEIMYIASKYF